MEQPSVSWGECEQHSKILIVTKLGTKPSFAKMPFMRFNFILGLNFIFLCFWVFYSNVYLNEFKQGGIKFKPRIKLNHHNSKV